MRTRRVPQRMCVGCKTMYPKRDLIRVVRTPTGEVLLDPTGKKSGRGAYICPNPECLDVALKGGYLQRALSVDIGPEVADSLRDAIHGAG
ncbi:MAG: YlxR family protein [Firmicutes bacterium]|nr:YlxR family protein [Bacillota bacterium]